LTQPFLLDIHQVSSGIGAKEQIIINPAPIVHYHHHHLEIDPEEEEREYQ
jgi:hypothetical protein